jgi:hypothetical protein
MAEGHVDAQAEKRELALIGEDVIPKAAATELTVVRVVGIPNPQIKAVTKSKGLPKRGSFKMRKAYPVSTVNTAHIHQYPEFSRWILPRI